MKDDPSLAREEKKKKPQPQPINHQTPIPSSCLIPRKLASQILLISRSSASWF
jgi:hypothetical protein